MTSTKLGYLIRNMFISSTYDIRVGSTLNAQAITCYDLNTMLSVVYTFCLSFYSKNEYTWLQLIKCYINCITNK